jgi:peroxiredoxin
MHSTKPNRFLRLSDITTKNNESANMIKIALIAFGIVVTTAGMTFAEAEVGKSAPEFSLPATNGKTFNLKDFKGKIVVLEWYNPDCPFVHKHYDSGNMQKLQKKYAPKGVVWLTIDSSAPGQQGNYSAEKLSNITWKEKPGWNALLMDPSGEVGHLYGAKTTPNMFIIDTKGMVVYKGAIDDKPTTDTADIEAANNFVSRALDETIAGKRVTIPFKKPYGCSVKYASGN